MKKAYVMTGLMLVIGLIVLISTNYFIISEKNNDSLLIEIDQVHNRAVDVYRIIQDAINDGECNNLNALLSDPLLDSEGITTSFTSDLTTCPAPSIKVYIDSTNVHKEFDYPS